MSRPSRSIHSASSASASPPALALGGVRRCRRWPRRARVAHALGMRERDVQRQAPALRVAREREAPGDEPDRIGDARVEVDRPPRGGRAVAPDVGSERAVAFAVEVTHHLIPAAPGLREAVQEEERLGHSLHHARPPRHPPAAARVRRRARALRRARGVHLAGLALLTARARARPRAAAALLLAHRRALRGVLRARRGEARRPAGRRHLHVGHGGGQPRPRRDRGPRGARAAHRAHRRPAARAARGRRRPDDRSDQALRHRGEVVLRGRHARRLARAHALDARPGLPRRLDGAGGTAGPGAPELRAARAAAAAGRAARGSAAGAQRRAPVGAALDPGRGPRRGRPRARPSSRATRTGRSSSPGAPSRGWRRSPAACATARLAAAGRSAERRAARRRGDRALRRAPAPARSSPTPGGPISSCAAATCRPPSRCAPGWTASARTSPSSASTRTAPGRTRPPRCRSCSPPRPRRR